MEAHITAFCERFFAGILRPVFAPMNNFLALFYQPWATICAIAFFVGTMIWVGAILNEKYVNRGRPNKEPWTDLRIWIVVSMIPHVIMYLYFT